MEFYGKMQDMECLSGDTLPVFDIEVEVGEGSIEGGTMFIFVAKSDSPHIPLICKACEATEDGFSVQLVSQDTSGLMEGTYDMHFCFTASDGNSYRKLFGTLYVHTAAQGGVS
ncbi:MAG: hypothetical protein IJK30_07570 [Ruminococcus sp.]|nr:hypothetical protein [Ruminococcus sp.]